jgi:DNA-binding NarL/FixJ family response regulator
MPAPSGLAPSSAAPSEVARSEVARSGPAQGGSGGAAAAPAVDPGADVALVSAAAVDEPTLRRVREVQQTGVPVVLVVAELDAHDLTAAVDAGVVGLLRRVDATPDAVLAAVRGAAAGDGYLPPDLLGPLLRQVRQVSTQVLAPRGLSFSGLTERELTVLRLVAEGCDTREISRRLCYSERTVKNVLQDITRRFGLRNRSHAVAYALRHGLL